MIATKLRPPSVPADLVVRSRLHALLDSLSRRRVSLLSAPAASGKTTLVADWIGRSGGPTAWLSLDPLDRNALGFVEYLSASIARATGSPLRETEFRLTNTEPSVESIAEALCADVASLEAPLTVVLDDYQAVEGSEVDPLVERLVECAPEEVHVVILTRADPASLPLARWRTRGWLDHLPAEALRFTPEEARAFFASGENTVFEPGPVSDFLEGWPGGLRLLRAAGARRHPPAEPGSAPPDRVVRAAADFLEAEVLSALPEDVVQLLLLTTAVDHFSAEMCSAVLSNGGDTSTPDRPIEELERRNLFVTTFDGRGGWHRHHAFFREVAANYLMREFGPEAVDEVRGRVAAWFEDHDFVEEALRLWIGVGDVGRAARLLGERLDNVLVEDVSRRILLRWLSVFPEGAEAVHPELLLARATIDVVRWNLDGIRQRTAAAGALLDARGEEAATLREIAEACRAVEEFWRGNLPEADRLSARLLESRRPENSGWAWTAGVHVQALVLSTSGRSDQAQALLQGLEEIDATRGSRYAGLLLVTRANVDLLAGNVVEAARHCRRLLAIAETVDVEEWWLGCARYGLGVAEYEQGALDDAELHFAGLSDLENRVPARLYHGGLAGRGVAALARGDRSAAREHAAASLAFALRLNDPGSKAISESLSARIEASPVAVPSGQISGLSFMGPWLEYPPVTMARRLANEERSDVASSLDYTDRAAAAARRVSNERAGIALALVRAVLLDRFGRHSESLEALQTSLDRALALGLEQTVLDTGPALIAPLERLLEGALWGDPRRQLLHALHAEHATVDAKGSSSTVLTPRERDVLFLLQLRLSNAEIAERLFLSSETVKSHLSAIYRKLGVHSRKAAVRAALEGELDEDTTAR